MIIFDWDGTLCDSAGHIVHALQAAAVEVGVAAPTDAAARDIIGLGLPQALARLFPQMAAALREDMAAAYARHYIASEEAPPALFPGALDLLTGLQARGRELAVATGKSRRGLDRILAIHGLENVFHATRCADETRSKPDPLMLHELLAERGVAHGDAIMVGDTEYDLEMASNAGIASVGVSFGVHSAERLRAHRPVAIIDTLSELLALPQAR